LFPKVSFVVIILKVFATKVMATEATLSKYILANSGTVSAFIELVF
jgi:hypothetical protein